MENELSENWPEIVEAHYRGIYSFAFQFTGNRTDAEDVCQETFLKAQEKLHTLQDHDKLRSWLFQIARNCCIDKTRWYKRLTFSTAADTDDQELNSDILLSQELLRCIKKLPRQQRAVFLLRVLHDFSTAETAESLTISTGSVKSHLSRAMKELRMNLAACFLEMTTEDVTTPSTSMQGEKA